MKNNNALFAQGAYHWALTQVQHYGSNGPCTVDMESTLKSFEKGGHDVKISIFEPQTDKEKADVILMLEWIEFHKEKITIYSIEKNHYETLKQQYPGYIALFKMNGRIRYMEELKAGRATPPYFLVDL